VCSLYDTWNYILQYVEVVPPMDKYRSVEQILRRREPRSRIIIFYSIKKMCDQLARSLGQQFGAIVIHEDKSQGEKDWFFGQLRRLDIFSFFQVGCFSLHLHWIQTLAYLFTFPFHLIPRVDALSCGVAK
jgi:hypothetical protein